MVWEFDSGKANDSRQNFNSSRLDRGENRSRRRNRDSNRSLAIVPSESSRIPKALPPSRTPSGETRRMRGVVTPQKTTPTPKEYPNSSTKPLRERDLNSPKRSSRRQRERSAPDRDKLLLKLQRQRRLAETDLTATTTPLPPPKPQKPATSLAFALLRLIIVGIGIGAIAGTVLSYANPAKKPLPETTQNEQKTTTTNQTKTNSHTTVLTLGQPLQPLQDQVKALFATYPQLQPQIFFIDLDDNSYIDINGANPIHAASTIKVPILVAFFQDVDAGKIKLDEMLTITPEVIGGGSGDLQYKPPGTKLTALETAIKMIEISDNTATNMIITRLGGKDVLNQRFKQWGLKTTVINNPLPDLEGTNLTSPQDLSHVMIMVGQGELVSMKSRDRLLDIMKLTKTRTLLPQGLGAGATISHKTGDIGIVLGDVGLIDLPNGKRYIGAVIVKRPHNDPKGRELIQKISRTVYEYFNKPPKSSTTSAPKGTLKTVANYDNQDF